jgi:hypothetical protein
MEKLFSDVQAGGGNCPGCNELDSYLKLQRGLNPGNNFAQMGRSRKSGVGSGRGLGQGLGQGDSGQSGSAMMDGARVDVLGNEARAERGRPAARQSNRQGQGLGAVALNDAGLQTDNADVLKNLNPVNRQSGAVAAEAPIEEYSDLVDHYFKTITTGKKP